MQYRCALKLIRLVIICDLFGMLQADPIIFLKNNSNRIISVEPLSEEATFPAELKKPDGEYILNNSNNRITGLRIKYCPTGSICNINDEDNFNRIAKSTTFYFHAPEAKKYYVKLTIDAQDKVVLKAQEGSVFGRTSNMKWSLSGNIKTDDIKSTPPRPQQAAPERIREMVSKVGISSPITPFFSQSAEISKHLPDVEKRLQEIAGELKKLKEIASKKNITREDLENIDGRLDTANKKLRGLKDDIDLMQYELTSNEGALLQEIDESFVTIENTISKLRNFLKMPSRGAISTSSAIRTGKSEGGRSELTVEEREMVLKAIKQLAPALYNLIVKEDPTGKNHIFLDPYDRGMSVRPSWTSGLPEIAIERESLHWPWGEFLFVVGHELAHYILGDLLEEYHNDYPVEDIMKLARQRLIENECDRMSVLEFGNNIDDGIAHHQYVIKREEEDKLSQPHKETFKKDHSLSADRIKYLELLRREVELKPRSTHFTESDWKALIQKYKKAAQLKPVDTSLVQKYVNKTYTQADLDEYANKAILKYKGAGQINYLVQGDVDERGKPWTLDNIAEFLSSNLSDVDLALKGKKFMDEDADNNLAADVLYTYYNAKLLELKFPGDKEVQAVTKSTLKLLLNKQIIGKDAITIIQQFER